MFIPPGTTIYESLATSYVLVDALVADLCEGGFSGVVEVVLRATDSFIVIASGEVAGVVEKRGGPTTPASSAAYARTSVEQIAELSRRERGRVSVRGYSPAIANAIAGRINAQPLYVGLSTEFTDLKKMISKLVREPDREWFIEVGDGDGPTALIHMRDAECRIIRSAGDLNSGAPEGASNPALSLLVDECSRAGSSFDVYFNHTAETTDKRVERPDPKPIPEPPAPEAALASEELASLQQAASGSLLSNDLFVRSSPEVHHISDSNLAASSLEHDGPPQGSNNAGTDAEALAEAAAPSLAGEAIEPQTGNLSLLWDELPATADGAEAMAEIKRLMGEIARAIEEAAQAVGRPDSFSLSLRAGQLEIAERFPFLDPFAGDFEYLAGEIVFIGQAPAEDFVAGFTEALKLAIESVTRSTAYADRFRAYMAEDLRKLLARERAEFERFGLDQVIQQLSTA